MIKKRPIHLGAREFFHHASKWVTKARKGATIIVSWRGKAEIVVRRRER